METETAELLEEIKKNNTLESEPHFELLFEKCDSLSPEERKELFLSKNYRYGYFTYKYMESDYRRHDDLVAMSTDIRDGFVKAYLYYLNRASKAEKLSKIYRDAIYYAKANPIITQHCIVDLIRSIQEANDADFTKNTLTMVINLIDKLEPFDFDSVNESFSPKHFHKTNVWLELMKRNNLLYRFEDLFIQIVRKLIAKKASLSSTKYATPIAGLARREWFLKHNVLEFALHSYEGLDTTDLGEAITTIIQTGQHLDNVACREFKQGNITFYEPVYVGEYSENNLKSNVVSLLERLQQNPTWDNIFLSNPNLRPASDTETIAYILCHAPECSLPTDLRVYKIPLGVNIAATYFANVKEQLIDAFLTDASVKASPQNYIVAFTALALNSSVLQVNMMSQKLLHFLSNSKVACAILNDWRLNKYPNPKGYSAVHSKLHRNLDKIGKAILPMELEQLILEPNQNYPAPFKMAMEANNGEFFKFILENIYPTASKEFKQKVNACIVELQKTANPEDIECIESYLESYRNQKYWYVPNALMPIFSTVVSNRGYLLEEIKDTARKVSAARPTLTQ